MKKNLDKKEVQFDPKILDKKILSKKNVGSKNFWFPKTFESKKILCLKNTQIQKDLKVQKKIWSNNVRDPKTFCVLKDFVSKKIGSSLNLIV